MKSSGVFNGIAGAIKAYTQDRKVREEPGDANASFNIRSLFPSMGEDLNVRFRDTKNRGFGKRSSMVEALGFLYNTLIPAPG